MYMLYQLYQVYVYIEIYWLVCMYIFIYVYMCTCYVTYVSHTKFYPNIGVYPMIGGYEWLLWGHKHNIQENGYIMDTYCLYNVDYWLMALNDVSL